MNSRELEFAFAAEAAAHTSAAADLNPYAEAEVLELGNARAVYSGAWSPVHGVSGLGLDGPVEARDLQEIDRFYLRKERAPAFWICPHTDPSLLALIERDYHKTHVVSVHGLPLSEPADLPEPAGSNAPEPAEWTLAFTRSIDPGANESGLFALTKLHQKESRYYLGTGGASYTFFHQGVALVPAPSIFSLLSLQARDAKDWGAAFLATSCSPHTHNASPLPLIYERSLYERI